MCVYTHEIEVAPTPLTKTTTRPPSYSMYPTHPSTHHRQEAPLDNTTTTNLLRKLNERVSEGLAALRSLGQSDVLDLGKMPTKPTKYQTWLKQVCAEIMAAADAKRLCEELAYTLVVHRQCDAFAG